MYKQRKRERLWVGLGRWRFMPFWKIGNPSFTPLNQGPDRFVAVEHAISLTTRMQLSMPGNDFDV